MKKILIASLLAALMVGGFATPVLAAQTASQSEYNALILQLIDLLMARVNELQAQLAAQRGEIAPEPIVSRSLDVVAEPARATETEILCNSKCDVTGGAPHACERDVYHLNQNASRMTDTVLYRECSLRTVYSDGSGVVSDVPLADPR